MGMKISDYHAMRDRLEKGRKPGESATDHRRRLAGANPQTANAAPGVRIRQDAKPLLNKLEKQWFDILKAGGSVTNLSAQALRFKLANGAWYKCDIVGWVNGRLTGWECKGPSRMKNVDRGILTVKIAATQWPEIDFFLVWKDRGEFRQQKVLP